MDGLANVITRILFMVMLCVCLMVVTVPLNLSMLTQSALLLLLSFSVNLFTYRHTYDVHFIITLCFKIVEWFFFPHFHAMGVIIITTKLPSTEW